MPVKCPHWFTIFAILNLASCAGNRPPQDYLRTMGTIPESHLRFTVCNLADCEETANVTVSASDWNRMSAAFSPQAADSTQERDRISAAIAEFENLVGVQAGTYDDQPAGRSGFRSTRQLDCVAETVNTTIYLLLLQQQDLLHWHTVGYPAHRGFANLQMPHNTAVITDISSGEQFAVDSYYHANGEAPEIVPLATWRAGFKPDK